VIVDAGAAAPRAFLGSRQTADVTPVIVAPEKRHVIGNPHALLVILLHLFVQSPELRNLGHVTIHLLADNTALVGYDLLHELDVVLDGRAGHGHVAIAAHPDAGDALVVSVAMDALGPEGPQHVGILRVVPRAGAMARPLLLRAQHRLVVGVAHYDAE